MKTTSFFILTGAFSPAVYAFFGHLDPGPLAVAATSLLGFIGLLIQLREARKAAEREAKRQDDQRIADKEAADTQRAADKELAEQHRQWDLDDRAATAKAFTTKLGTEAAGVKAMIDENSDISRKAFKEANNVNDKIESLGQTLVLKQSKPKAARKRNGAKTR